MFRFTKYVHSPFELDEWKEHFSERKIRWFIEKRRPGYSLWREGMEYVTEDPRRSRESVRAGDIVEWCEGGVWRDEESNAG